MAVDATKERHMPISPGTVSNLDVLIFLAVLIAIVAALMLTLETTSAGRNRDRSRRKSRRSSSLSRTPLMLISRRGRPRCAPRAVHRNL